MTDAERVAELTRKYFHEDLRLGRQTNIQKRVLADVLGPYCPKLEALAAKRARKQAQKH